MRLRCSSANYILRILVTFLRLVLLRHEIPKNLSRVPSPNFPRFSSAYFSRAHARLRKIRAGSRDCPKAQRPEEANGDPHTHAGADPEAHGPQGAGEDTYMHVGAGPETHRPEGASGDPYMYVGAGADAHGPRGVVGTRTYTWEPVWTPTGPSGTVRTPT